MRWEAGLLNAACGIALAFLLWKYNLWAAGDAKFFIVSVFFSHLFSPAVRISGVPIPVSVIVLCNALIISFIAVCAEALWTGICKARRCGIGRSLSNGLRALKTTVRSRDFIISQIKALLYYSISFILILYVMNYFSSAVSPGPVVFIAFSILIFLLYRPLRYYLVRLPMPYLIIILMVAIVAVRVDIFILFGQMLKFFVLFGVCNAAIVSFIKTKEIAVLPIERLAPRVQLTTGELNQLPGELRSLGRFYSDGLTVEQAATFKAYFESIHKKTVQVYRTFPFVPFIVMSTVGVYFFGARPIDVFFFLR